ncbi:MAG: leucyl aminopeptidase [Thermoleophilia bacterium]|nr:leucyl aminopeptidase [Thermoleophilia bacterium]
MEVEVAQASPEDVEADVLGFVVTEPVELSPLARALDEAVGGRLARLVGDGEVTGASGEVTVLHAPDGSRVGRLALAGIGARLDGDADAVRAAAARVVDRVGGAGARSVAWLLDEDGLALDPHEQARAAVEGVSLGRYDAGRWKTEPNRGAPLERLVLCGPAAAAVAEEAARSAVVTAWTNRCRDIVNAPPNELTPEALAAVGREIADRFPAVRDESLGPSEIEAAGMGAFAAVAQGSHNPPQLIVLNYEPEGAREDILVGLVGKALTFDAGGLSLKPADGMEEMKSDMGGGAAVLAALGAIAELELPVRILAVVPACENMPGGHAYRPGDIVKAASGTTIEITNTDAEGRLILADALWHARERGATHVLDLATLTGTISVALGDFYAGLFSPDEEWRGEILAAAGASGDHAWPFPLHATYRRFLDSTFADLKNCPEKGRGSSIIAALFLEAFAGAGAWAHLDIAGTAYLDRPRDYYLRPGATGFGVRLLVELARRLAA